MAKPLRILLVSSEVAPFAKVGGLADVAGALPLALAALGHDVRVVMPCYPLVEGDARFQATPFIDDLATPMTRDPGAPVERGAVLRVWIEGKIPVYLMRHPEFFRSAVAPSVIYPQPVDAYLYFSQAVFALLRRLAQEFQPDIIHCNDWHTGLIPALLSTVYRPAGEWTRLASVFTIHNLAYHGEYPRSVLDRVGLAQSLFTPEGLEFFGKANFMKAGILYSDLVTTVSPTYAREIQTSEHGAGMEGVLRGIARAGRLRGIRNGIDTSEYNPAIDSRLPVTFSAADPAGKAECRRQLQRERKLLEQGQSPLVGMVSRLVEQKGLDLLASLLPRLIELGFQFIVLGQGQRIYEELFLSAARRYPDRVAAVIGYQNDLGQRIYAGSDVFLMPSRFEPCGLGQMISMRYGSLPVVRSTGGLADTVTDDAGLRPDANGFVFEGYAPETLMECMKRVQTAYANRSRWQGLVQNALKTDFSWNGPAQEYVDAYQDGMNNVRPSS